MTSTEQDYLKAVATGDRAGIKKIYAQFFQRIASLITKNGGSFEDAQDVFQDAILILYEKTKAPNFKLTSNFYTLLHGTCRNLWGNRLQKKSFQEVTLPEDFKYTSEESVEDDFLALEESQVFWQAFQKLGPDCQKLMTLFFDKVKMQEIMELMGFGSVSYAKKRKFQCKEKLIDWVKKDARFAELKK